MLRGFLAVVVLESLAIDPPAHVDYIVAVTATGGHAALALAARVLLGLGVAWRRRA